MRKKQKSKGFLTKHANTLKEFFDLAENALCLSPEAQKEAFSSFSFLMRQGVVFSQKPNFARATLKTAEKIVETIGSEKVSVEEAENVLLDTVAEAVLDENLTIENFKSALFDKLEGLTEDAFEFVGPCELFSFPEDVDSLSSKFVSVVPTDTIQNKFSASDSHGISPNLPIATSHSDRKTVGDFGKHCWLINTRASKKNAPNAARWMAEVFTSAVRVGLRPADYCFRPQIGGVEVQPHEVWNKYDNHVMFQNDAWTGFGMQACRTYKVSNQLSEDFQNSDFQAKLEAIFESDTSLLGGRVRDGLIWLSRGRQSSDPSERLLMFFTALEALLCNQDSFSPVSDSIARYVAVIVSDSPSTREATYKELRKLYCLRSDVVHRGRRDAHELNANNVQVLTEIAYSTVFIK